MQFFLYLVVGGLSFLVEIATFIALRRAAMPVIPASVTSFIIATIANYLLSIVLAFQRGRFRRQAELARFLGVVLVGLGLNTALVWIFVYPFAIPPTLAKISVVPIVLVWNYLGRRMVVFDTGIPIRIRFWLSPASRGEAGLPSLGQRSGRLGEGVGTAAIRSRSARWTRSRRVAFGLEPAEFGGVKSFKRGSADLD
jgi:putative flippase GtrA